jgi:hypothetical protein
VSAARPFVQVYRYRLRPDAVERCLEIWARAQEVYARHVPMTSLHLRSAEEPDVWLELNVFPDEDSYRRGIELVDADPDHDAVWREMEAELQDGVEAESFEEVARFP